MSLVSWNWRKLATGLILLVGAFVIALVLMEIVEMAVYLVDGFLREVREGDR